MSMVWLLLFFFLSEFRTGVSESKSNKRIQLRIWSKCDQIWNSLTQISLKKIAQFDCVHTVQRNKNTLLLLYRAVFCYLFRVLEFKSFVLNCMGGGGEGERQSASNINIQCQKCTIPENEHLNAPNGIHLCSFYYEIHKFRIKKIKYKLTGDILNHAPAQTFASFKKEKKNGFWETDRWIFCDAFKSNRKWTQPEEFNTSNLKSLLYSAAQWPIKIERQIMRCKMKDFWLFCYCIKF